MPGFFAPFDLPRSGGGSMPAPMARPFWKGTVRHRHSVTPGIVGTATAHSPGGAAGRWRSDPVRRGRVFRLRAAQGAPRLRAVRADVRAHAGANRGCRADGPTV